MIKQDVFNLNETMLWTSAIVLVLLSYFVSNVFSVIAFFWILRIIIVGNARYLFFNKHESLFYYIRRSLYPISCLFPIVLDLQIKLFVKNVALWICLSIVLGICFILPKYKSWRLFLSADIIVLCPPKKKNDYLSQMLLLIAASISEEIFYRAFIIGSLKGITPLPFSIVLSCFLFFLHHYGVKWNSQFTKYDYCVQILFALTSSMLFVLSGSILPSIVAHLTYNSMSIVLEAKSYYLNYVK